MFEAVDAVISYQRTHVSMDGFVPPGNGDMKAVVRYRFLSPFTPLSIGIKNVLLWIRNDEIDDHGGTASETRSRTGFEIFAGHRSHEGQLHVGMRVYTAGHYILSASVNDRSA